MDDEITQMKAELAALNLQCQLARDHEIRYALQRTRLETSRMQLMVKLMDAHRGTPPEAVSSPLPYAVSYKSNPPTPFDAAGLNGARAVVAAFTDVASAAAAGAVSQAKRKPKLKLKLKLKLKPDGLPTTTAMVRTVIGDAGTGLTPREVGAAIERRWWPNIPQPALRAISAWVCRLAKEGKLVRGDSGRYTLAKPAGTATRQLVDYDVS